MRRTRLVPLLAALALWAVPAGAQTAAGEVEFIAHRGESADAPENTLSAVRLAWERGVRTVEIDVHLSRDGRLVVSHDANTERTTGVSREIRESTWEELRTLDAGRWKGARWTGERMPTLEEVLATIPDNGRVFIEVKVGPEAIPELERVVRESGKRPEQLAVISFNAESVAEAKRRLPELDAYYLSSFRRDGDSGRWTPGIDELIERAKEIRADGLNLSYRGPIDRELVERVRAAGLGMYVWTVDDPAVARRMIAAGVQGITSNRAAWLRKAVAEK